MQDTSWPVWNEEFTFPIDMKKAKRSSDTSNLSVLNGYFISLTVYAVLEVNDAKDDKKKKSVKGNEPQKPNEAKSAEPTTTLAKFEQLMSSTFKTSKATQTSSSPDKRRTIGAATWNFDLKLFQNNLKNDMIGTPDIWRPIEQMGSGIAPANGIVSIHFIQSLFKRYK